MVQGRVGVTVMAVSFDLTAQRRLNWGSFFVLFIFFFFLLFHKREQEAFFQFPFSGLAHNDRGGQEGGISTVVMVTCRCFSSVQTLFRI